jgi:hypothetical protein
MKMDLVEIKWDGLAQDRDKWMALVIAVMNPAVPLKYWKVRD